MLHFIVGILMLVQTQVGQAYIPQTVEDGQDYGKDCDDCSSSCSDSQDCEASIQPKRKPDHGRPYMSDTLLPMGFTARTMPQGKSGMTLGAITTTMAWGHDGYELGFQNFLIPAGFFSFLFMGVEDEGGLVPAVLALMAIVAMVPQPYIKYSLYENLNSGEYLSIMLHLGVFGGAYLTYSSFGRYLDFHASTGVSVVTPGILYGIFGSLSAMVHLGDTVHIFAQVRTDAGTLTGDNESGRGRGKGIQGAGFVGMRLSWKSFYMDIMAGGMYVFERPDPSDSEENTEDDSSSSGGNEGLPWAQIAIGWDF